MEKQAGIPDLPVVFHYGRGTAGCFALGTAAAAMYLTLSAHTGAPWLGLEGVWLWALCAFAWAVFVCGPLYLLRTRVVFASEQLRVRGLWRWSCYSYQTLTGVVRRHWSTYRFRGRGDCLRVVCLERDGKIVADLSQMVIPGRGYPASLGTAIALTQALCPATRYF